MIVYLILLFVGLVSLGQTSILQCNFETPCQDFTLDRNWGVTDGLHPLPIDHDHTLNTTSGHYVFYNPQSSPKFQLAEIKTNTWLELPTDRAVCFQMWYYTSSLDFPFNIQLVQGNDEQLTRIVASIPGKDPSINEWTQIKITLPAEKFKVFIRLNTTTGSLAFDDFLVDYCDEPHPPPSKTLFSCDFESSCIDDFISLSNYPYQWSVIEASDAIKKESDAPSIDNTFGNASGHYAWLANYNLIQPGKVGYLAMKKPIHITSDESFCLNLNYYLYGRATSSNLLVYTWTSGTSDELQVIWPNRNSGHAIYTKNQWSWGIINLPVGDYTILFRMDSTDIIQSSFALDDIKITSCAYPPTQLLPYNSILSFVCNFDDLTICNMANTDDFKPPSFNFTVVTGDTVPNKELGPNRDHTNNSSSGGFVYWNQQLPFTSSDTGFIRPEKRIEQNFGMCIRFAYYVKSSAMNKNGTTLLLRAGGCYGKEMWTNSLDDSLGWQVVMIPVEKYACMERFYFRVTQTVPVAVSVAFDDIEIAQCPSFDPTTTTTISTSIPTTITTQTTTISTIISTSTIKTTQTTTSSLSTTSKMSTTTTTTITSSYHTSTSSKAVNLLSMKYIYLMSFILSKLFFTIMF
ncbi:unnamed protein product [Adineta steineri]|uniref:MAM domain-containing protein n=1 Tax=Adineta steineri TaxID=433720 RepID=A0A819KPZ1_9BILA|nr:unnamed protein product [Adineta steineri]